MNFYQGKYKSRGGTSLAERTDESALLVLNPLLDFIHNKGKAYIPGAEEVTTNVCQLITRGIAEQVFISLDYNVWGTNPYAVKGTIGAGLAPAIENALLSENNQEKQPSFLLRRAVSWFDPGGFNAGRRAFESALSKYREIIVVGFRKNLEVLDFVEYWLDQYSFGIHQLTLVHDLCLEDPRIDLIKNHSDIYKKLRKEGLEIINSKELL